MLLPRSFARLDMRHRVLEEERMGRSFGDVEDTKPFHCLAKEILKGIIASAFDLVLRQLGVVMLTSARV